MAAFKPSGYFRRALPTGKFGKRFLLGAAAANAPDAMTVGQWSVADKGTDGAITITVSTLPSDGGSAITALQYRIDGGSWVTMAGTGTGARDVTGLSNSVQITVDLRAVNAVGNATASDGKTVIPRLAEINTYRAACTVAPTLPHELLVSTMVSSLKSGGFWAGFSNITLLCAETAQAARVNLKDPSKVATISGSPTHTAGLGYAGDEASAYLDFGESFGASSHLTLNSASLYAACNQQNGATGVKSHLGSTNGTPITFVGATSSGNPVQRVNGTAGVSGGTSDGNRARRRWSLRNDASNISYIRNGVEQFTSAAASTNIVTGNVTALRVGSSYTSDRLAMVAWGAGLSVADAISVDTIFTTFLTGVGAN
ncbi:hypothetical protein [uncultured Amaricoccus sp.]|uniref:hypothetical protein n=1 Tax=uncultured Amaricoccus sp. TaxID=339341 RepID=UPI002601E6D2|nr:hypothetical protein [uncultured Amaricoccus sp.]